MSESETTKTDVQQGLAIVTHQIQAPLIAAMGALSSIDPDSLPHSTQIRVSYSQALLEDALNICYGMYASFAQATGTEISLHSQEIDVPTELRTLCERLQQTAARQDLSFQYLSDSDLSSVKMDRNIFTSVFYSLIHNAIKYADQNSTVRLECRVDRQSGNTNIKIKSKGVPIYPSEQDSIFERFTRGQAVGATGRSYAGVGLGLWIARQLMRAVGGNLSLELSPNHPDLSIFVVYIPIAELRPHSAQVSWDSSGIRAIEGEHKRRNLEAIIGGVAADVEEDPMV